MLAIPAAPSHPTQTDSSSITDYSSQMSFVCATPAMKKYEIEWPLLRWAEEHQFVCVCDQCINFSRMYMIQGYFFSVYTEVHNVPFELHNLQTSHLFRTDHRVGRLFELSSVKVPSHLLLPPSHLTCGIHV